MTIAFVYAIFFGCFAYIHGGGAVGMVDVFDQQTKLPVHHKAKRLIVARAMTADRLGYLLGDNGLDCRSEERAS